MPDGALKAARALAGAALASLEASRGRIDDLNVYPVPDGDTGTNMALTGRAVADALADSSAATSAEVAREATRACLMGARGNSGVILSQLVRGAAETLAAGAPVDAAALGHALRAASDAGYAAVREPQEGTILTVARALAERAEALAVTGPELGEALTAIVAAAEDALARTPDDLPLLREAGVVDAGGAGLVEIVRGIAAHVRGEPLPDPPADRRALPLEAVHRELSRFRYCTSFFVEGEDADPDELERFLLELGDSVLVVGSRGAVKAHVHTDDPGRALSAATAVGVLEEVDVKNMHTQTTERAERLAARGEPAASADGEPAASAVVAVVAGEGNARLFREYGAERLVECGRSMNPPTSAIVEAIDAVTAGEALVLPNNENVVSAAEQAVAAAAKRAFVVPTRSLQAGISALIAFDQEKPAEENAAEMSAAAAAVRAGAVARASRSTLVGGLAIEQGAFVGLLDGEPVATGPVLDQVAREVVERLLDGGAGVLTILVGEDAADVDVLRAEVAAGHPGLEIDVHPGGQPHYPLLLAAE